MSFFGKLRDLFSGVFGGYAPHIDPPVSACANAVEALQQAQALGMPYHTTGTPSMVPLIPAAVCMLAVQPVAYDTARLLGRVLCYNAKWNPQSPVCHRAVAKDSYGLIMSGDNNRYSEPSERVTADNLIGEVVAVFTFPLS